MNESYVVDWDIAGRGGARVDMRRALRRERENRERRRMMERCWDCGYFESCARLPDSCAKDKHKANKKEDDDGEI